MLAQQPLRININYQLLTRNYLIRCCGMGVNQQALLVLLSGLWDFLQMLVVD